MKAQLLTLLSLSISIFTFAQIQVFPEIYFEHNGENSGLPDGYITYRIYCLSNEADFGVTSVYGQSEGIGLYISANNDIYQHQYGSAFGTTLNSSLFELNPDLVYDSFVTINSSYDDEYEGNLTTTNLDPSSAFTDFEGGADLVMNSGIWFTLNTEETFSGDGSGKILIAQITTSEALSYSLCIGTEYTPDGGPTGSFQFVNSNGSEILESGYSMGLTHPAPEGTIIPGCTDPMSVDFNPIANEDNGACTYVNGCTDPTACNYNPLAISDDGSCILPDGCTDAEAENYNPMATCDDGSCEYFFPEFQVYHEVYAEHDGSIAELPEGYITYRIYVDFEDPSHKLINIPAYSDIGPIYIQADNDIYQDESGSTLPVDACALFNTYPSLEFDSFISLNKDCDSNLGTIVYQATDPTDVFDSFEEGNDMYINDGLWYSVPTEPNTLQEEGKFLIAQITTSSPLSYSFNFQMLIQGQFGNDFVCSAYLNGDVNTPAPYAYERGMIYPIPNAVYGCTDPLACNYDQASTADDGSCIYPDGCTDPMALNYDPAALCDDDSCIYNIGEGCEVEFYPEIISTDPPVMNLVVDFSSLEEFDHLWDFGDGSTSEELFPTHIYSSDGTYEVCLTVSTAIPGEPECTSVFCGLISTDDFPQIVGGGANGIEGMNGFTVNVLDGSVGITEALESMISIYPNPVADLLNIELKEGFWNLNIYSSTGEQVLNRSNIQNRDMVNVESWSAGIYIIRLSNNIGEQKIARITVK